MGIMRFLLLLTLILISTPWSQTPPEVLVELPNGLRQKALLLGIQADTVSLGGQVNGEQTTVRLHRSRLKSILLLPDSTPINLEAPYPPPPPITDSVSEAPEHDWLGHLVLLPPDAQGMDSTFIEAAQSLTLNLLREKGKVPVILATPTELSESKTTEAMIQKLRKVGAIGLLGSQWKRKGDSLQVQFRCIWLRGDSLKTVTGSYSTKTQTPTISLLNGEPWAALEKATGLSLMIKSVEKKGSSIWVESDPDGALISVNRQTPACRAPCRVPLSADSTGRATIWASWKVVNHLWASKSSVLVSPGDSSRLFLKLEPSHAVLQITTHPSGAEVYPATKSWSPSMRPSGRTPLILEDMDAGELLYRVSLPGYRDSVIRIVPDPTDRTQIHINLSPIIDPNLLAEQQARYSAVSKNRWGKGVMGASIAPLIVGGTLLWLANDDYDRASKIKTELMQPSSGKGPNFESRVHDNKQAIEDGDKKVTAGKILVGSGLAIFTLGFFLWF